MRVIQGVDVEHSPVKSLEEVTAIPRGTGKGRFQLARPGSYALVQDWAPPVGEDGVEVSLYFQPHLPQAGHLQAVMSTLDVQSKSGFAVIINENGVVDFWIGTGTTVDVVSTEFKPAQKRWVEMQLAFVGAQFTASLCPIAQVAEKAIDSQQVDVELSGRAHVLQPSPLLFAGSFAETTTTPFPRVTNFFNGRIDSPTIKTIGGSRILVQFDFSRNMSEDTIRDVSGGGHDGVLVNAPTRAVTGYNWDATEADWTKATSGYGAIHFHDDDLDDAGWDTDVSITIPNDARSGVYCVEVTSTDGKTSDMVTFFVRPTKETTAKVGAQVALVLSTFTYLAYANEQLADTSRSSHIDVGPGFDMASALHTEDFHRMQRRRDLGLSNYDVHNDDSGVTFSSAKRPILNIRPGYIMWAFSRPRELSAESMMIGFLEREGIPYDIITDHDLHTGGAAVLAPYNTVMTGCHPEYPSIESYNAYENYAKQGGNLMYLGGNGFYWVSATDPARPWRLEVRRGDQGVRSYTLPGGERFMSLNGTQGGLWRTRGRSSHFLFGVAFCGEGAGPGVPFKRCDASFDPQFKWMFDGIPDDELIGEFGLGGGASGDEIDSFDIACGSPTNAVVVATTPGHPDDFGIAPECTGFPIIDTLGTQTREIRSDIVYYETNAGGAVFSVGSINWYCSLGWDDYQNNVAKLTGNVIKEFLRREKKG